MFLDTTGLMAVVRLEKFEISPIILSALFVDGLDKFQLVGFRGANPKDNAFQGTEVEGQSTTSRLAYIAYQTVEDRAGLLLVFPISRLDELGRSVPNSPPSKHQYWF